jgi:hypothetical protein
MSSPACRIALLPAMATVAVVLSLGRAAEDKPAADLKKDLTPHYVTIQEKAIPLKAALQMVKDQTGIEIGDMRQERAEDPKIRLNLNKATFWQAADAIAREADLKIVPDRRGGKVSISDGPFKEMPTSYDGLFRVALKKLQVVQDLDADAHYCLAYFDVSWEPQFQAFLMEAQQSSLEAQDDKGRNLEIPEEGRGQLSVTARTGFEAEVRLPAPARSAATFKLVKGTIAIVGAPRMLDFTFDKVAKGEELTKEGVNVQIKQLKTDEQLWTVGFLLKYPPGGPQFESFQSWLVNNQAFLIKDGPRFEPNGGYEIEEQSGNRAIVYYRFVEERSKGLVFEKPEGYKVSLRTPAAIVEVPLKFEFKDVALP